MSPITSCFNFCFVFIVFNIYFSFYDRVILFSQIFLPFSFILSLITASHVDNVLVVLASAPTFLFKKLFTLFKASFVNLLVCLLFTATNYIFINFIVVLLKFRLNYLYIVLSIKYIFWLASTSLYRCSFFYLHMVTKRQRKCHCSTSTLASQLIVVEQRNYVLYSLIGAWFHYCWQ